VSSTEKPAVKFRPVFAFIPGLLAFPAAMVVSPVAAELFFSESPLPESVVHRLHAFQIIFFMLGLFNVGGILFTSRRSHGSRSGKGNRVFHGIFSGNMFFILLLSIDALLGVRFIDRPMIEELHVPDVVLGYRHRTNTNWEGITLNSYGTCGEEFSIPPPPGIERIVFLGDSITFGHGVSTERAIPARLEELLGESCEVINSGVQGYEIHQYFYMAKQVATYRPQQVLLGICLNDLSYAWDHRLSGASEEPSTRPLPGTPLNRIKWFLDRYSGVKNLNKLRSQKIPLEEFVNDPVEAAVTKLLTDSQLYRRKMQIFEKYLKGIADFYKVEGIALNVVIYPFRFQYNQPSIDRWPNYTILQEGIINQCNQLGVAVLDLLKPIGEAAKEHSNSAQEYFLDVDHFNPEGCQMVADIIAREVFSVSRQAESPKPDSPSR